MKKRFQLYISLVLIFICTFQDNLYAQDINDEEYKSRRIKILGKLDSLSSVVMRSSDFKMRSYDVEYRYHQESNFFYLTGVTKPNYYLIITPVGIDVNNRKCCVIIFSPDQKKDSVYINNNFNEALVSSDKFNEYLKAILKQFKNLFINSPNNIFIYDWLNDNNIFVEKNSKKTLESSYPGLKVESIDDLVFPLREIKSPSELKLIQKAIDITIQGVKNAIKICRPGRWEYELRAEIEYEMLRNGADYPGFPSIIGSDENSLILHYSDDNRQMKENEIVLMDVGAEYKGYSADITRTIPVSGKFTPAQSEVYQAVLEAQEEVIKIVRAGITFDSLNKKAKEIITQKGFGNYIIHGISHSLGIDVHDPYPDDTLKTGMVITVEPGIYIPKDAKDISEDYKGFGIRIEDDVLVTENGCRILSDGVLKNLNEIENLMKNNINE